MLILIIFVLNSKLKGSGEEKTVLLRDVAPVGGESEENRNLVAKIKLLF